MNDKTRNEFASLGLEILKRSALLVLYELHVCSPDKPYLRLTNVREQLDLPMLGKHNSLTHGILMHLADEGYAEWIGSGGQWQITPEGVSIIEG